MLSSPRRLVQENGKVPTLRTLAAIAAVSIAAAACAQPAREAAPAGYELERVVMTMRHGVRPPTKSDVTPKGTTAQPWPVWATGIGELTPHGAKGARLMGEYNRVYLASRGLVPATGCPAANVAYYASGKARAIDTAKSFAAGFAPGCAAKVEFPPSDKQDPEFHPTDSGMKLDPALAKAAALKLAPGGDLKAVSAGLSEEFALLQQVMKCCSAAYCDATKKSACSLGDTPTHVATNEGKPSLDGALGIASTAAQTLLLEYVEGKPAAEIGWGRAGKPEIQKLLRFHSVKFSHEVRPPYVAERYAGPLARRILDALDKPDAPRLTMLVGHDTNIAALGGFFDMHWVIGDYPPDSLPPGGALGFERLRDKSGRTYVRAFYQAQTMDQLRNLTPLTLAQPPAQVEVRIPGCSPQSGPAVCDLARFREIVTRKLEAPAPN
jgi:4-phytase/acid phosphatase